MSVDTIPSYPLGLMVDLRERMVRIETKLDMQAEDARKVSDFLDDHDTRLKLLETESSNIKSQVTTLKWLGGVIVTGLTLFGDRLTATFT